MVLILHNSLLLSHGNASFPTFLPRFYVAEESGREYCSRK